MSRKSRKIIRRINVVIGKLQMFVKVMICKDNFN